MDTNRVTKTNISSGALPYGDRNAFGSCIYLNVS